MQSALFILFGIKLGAPQMEKNLYHNTSGQLVISAAYSVT